MNNKIIRTRKLNEAPVKNYGTYEPNAYPRKSFYGKASVVEYSIESDERHDGYYKLEILKSYETYVMAKLTSYTTHNSVMIASAHKNCLTTNTTLRHIASFSGLNKKGYLGLDDSEALVELDKNPRMEKLLQQLLDELLQVATDESIDMDNRF